MFGDSSCAAASFSASPVSVLLELAELSRERLELVEGDLTRNRDALDAQRPEAANELSHRRAGLAHRQIADDHFLAKNADDDRRCRARAGHEARRPALPHCAARSGGWARTAECPAGQRQSAGAGRRRADGGPWGPAFTAPPSPLPARRAGRVRPHPAGRAGRSRCRSGAGRRPPSAGAPPS